MKQTCDGISQHPRTWYYLLDFNDSDNWSTISSKFGTNKLAELTHEQYWELFGIASSFDKLNSK